MSTPSPTARAGGLATERPFWLVVISVVSVVMLIWSEIWIVVAATIWSVDNLLGLGTIGYWLLGAVLVPLGLWASWHSARLAWRAESTARS